ncbi:hypothetical protein GNF10_23985 [Nostoc sp. UCD121]|uniref:hypothetical protein n=1 Tax=unclassified Nostoc TaxID=2593658 RepID=UPI001627E146|nr:MULTISPECIES: hypothetical protein [unclassified Nostoc]MBC1221046.1 hypothetical protein [Nostoc sp. UCD120]MBC1278942.1 hypothetical protein [Nostoc sp. UCD121]MBC1293896.1 hypothetical protein [Nostoc sp. UCD122]
MIALPGIAIQDKIYKSSNSLVYGGIRNDGVAIAIKLPGVAGIVHKCSGIAIEHFLCIF